MGYFLMSVDFFKRNWWEGETQHLTAVGWDFDMICLQEQPCGHNTCKPSTGLMIWSSSSASRKTFDGNNPLYTRFFIHGVLPNWGIFCSSGKIWQCLETFRVVTTWGRQCYCMQWVETSMLLNILQCPGQTPETKNYPAHGVPIWEVVNPGIHECLLMC